MDAALIAEFAVWLSRRPLAPRSVTAYRSDLLQYAAWRSSAGLPGGAGAGSQSEIRRFLSLSAAARTRQRKFSALARWFEFLVSSGHLPASPMAVMRSPSMPDRLPVLPSHAEVQQLFGAALSACERALLALVYCAGLRVAEVCALRVADIDLTGCAVSVPGDENRMAILGEQGSALLADYLASLPPGAGHDPLFLMGHMLFAGAGLRDVAALAGVRTKSLDRRFSRLPTAAMMQSYSVAFNGKMS
ncbi:MAG: hypothetical protein H7837_14080 [Magnetococcus sp. MYC-9]